MVEEDSYVEKMCKDLENAKKFRRSGISLTPESILFLDTFPGEEYKSKIMFMNISSHKIIVKVNKPYSLNFQVNDEGQPIFLSPGMSLIRVVSFKCTHEKVQDSHLPVFLNNHCLEVPIRVKHGTASLSVSPKRINFGTINLGAKCVSRYLLLTNTGAGSSKFSIDLGPNVLDMTAFPKKGTLMPYSSLRVKLDIAAFITGEHSTEFWVKGSPPTMIYVEVSVLTPFLQAVHPNTTARFTLIDFPPTYFLTARYETLIVRNMSSIPASFVVLAELHNQLMTINAVKEMETEDSLNYNNFSVEPLEGTLGPFESRIFTVWFHPNIKVPEKGWMHEQPVEKEYLCFLRVFKITVSDWIDKKIGKTYSVYDTNDESSDFLNLRLCLHGCGQKPQLGLLTSSFVFNPIKEGEKLTRVVHIKNCQDLPVFCRFKKSPGFDANPPEVLIQGGKSVELSLLFRVTSLGNSTKYVIFDILSYKNFTTEKGKSLIGHLKIPVQIGVQSITKVPEAKFVMGITPEIAHEVGIHTEDIKFSDKIVKPKGSMITKSHKNKPWLQSDDLIAFPNDRPRSLRVRETDKRMRSIFTGKRRYIPPIDKKNTYSEDEFKKIKEHENKYRKFLSEMTREKLNTILKEDEKHYWKKSPSELRLYRHMSLEPLQDKSKGLQRLSVNYELHDVYFPLTPSDLYNVRIMPKNLDFGQIPPYVNCTRRVAVENLNSFAIAVFLHMQKDFSNINDDYFIVGPKQRVEKNITLNLNNFGKYYSNVSFVVNHNDCYDMTLVADVVHRTLKIVPEEILIHSKNYQEDIFQVNWTSVRLENNLYVPTSFEWQVPAGSEFRVVPETGTVPGQRSICCAIHFGTAYELQSVSYIDLRVISGEHTQLKINRVQDTSHNVVVLLQKNILQPITVNWKHVETALLFNSGFKEAVFHVINPNPIDGITIFPTIGKIPGKSCIGITIEIQINAVVAFDFNLQIRVQYKNTLEAKFVGYVAFPKIRFLPKKLELLNVPCSSLTTHIIKAENFGYAATQLHFILKGYPQIKFSENKKHYKPGYKDGDVIVLPAATSKEFYLHFMPVEFATYELLLPVVLNHTIGPPLIYSDESQQPLTYIKQALRVNKILKNVDLSIPPKIASMKIDCSIGKGFLRFSDFSFQFGCPDKLCSQRKKLRIKNLTDGICHLTFDMKNMFPSPFRILKIQKDGLLELEPNGEEIIHIVFSPTYPDSFEVELPIFVKEYSQTIPYNIIHITGYLPKSSLTASESAIVFLPVPVGVTIEKCISIVASHQPRDSKLHHSVKRILGEYEEPLLEVSYPKGNKIPCYYTKGVPAVITVCFRFKSKKMASQRGAIVFVDDCEGTCEVLYSVCADKSVMSCYNYLTICRYAKDYKEKASVYTMQPKEEIGESCFFKIGEIKENTLDQEIFREVLEYPMFPPPTSETPYALTLRSIFQTMENWVFEQGFCGSFKMSIGEQTAFSKAFISVQNARAKNTNQSSIKSIIDLLYNFIGRDLFLEYTLPTSVPEDNIERIEYCLGIYKQVLRFLKVQGGNVAHIFPVYLLSYEDYTDHIDDYLKKSVEQKKKEMHYQDIFEGKFSKTKLLTQGDFERYNKQGWLDLFLQFHRVIIQAAIPYMKELRRIKITSQSSYCHETTDSGSSTNVTRTMDKGDKILIEWLNLVYIQVKMGNPELHLPPRTVADFSEDLEDAVVLTVVTLFYCPYLIDEFFSDFSFEPTDINEYLHNATLLCTAWTTIRLGMTVTPQDFLHVNPVFMILLVTHLYTVLRSYLPQRSIEFLASLTSSVTRKITLINPNDKSIGYSIKILGDCSQNFTIDRSRPLVVIPPRSIAPISITYVAKKLFPTNATMLLCGHCIPNGYVENIVLNLNGDPYNLMVTRDYSVNIPIMKPTFIVANVISPYDVEAEYELWYTEEEPKPGNLNIQPWSKLKVAKLPRSFFLSCDKLIVPPPTANYPAPLPITAACFTRTVLQFWVILRNDEIGDFIIRVVLTPKLEVPSLILRVPLPDSICTGYQSSVLCSSRCPRLLQVDIPSHNTRLWTTVKTMLNLTLQPEELSFWDKHYETRIGLDLMKWLLGKDAKSLAKEINFIFDSKVKYKLTSFSPQVQIQETMEIQDIHSHSFSKLMIHLCCWVQSEFCADILIESESEQEVRLYRLKFYGKTPLGSNVKDCKKSCSETKPDIEGACEDFENEA